jgi:hypothetical protein
MSTQPSACPPWCEIEKIGDDHADWADHGRIQHRADRSIPLSALPFDVPGHQQGHETVIVSLQARGGCEPVVTLALPESRKLHAEMTCAEALELAEAISELTTSAATGTAGLLTLVAGAA